MPRKKGSKNKKSAKLTNASSAKAKPQQSLTTIEKIKKSLPKLNWNESYVSLLLGLVVVFLVGVVVFSYVNGRSMNSPSKDTSSSTSEGTQNAPMMDKKPVPAGTYTVKEGDSLWTIAVDSYGDGYRWPDIQAANNLPWPDSIYEGLTLVLPK